MIENNYFFKKKLEHIKRQSKKKDILVIFILLLYNPLYYCKKRRTPIYLIKTLFKRNLKRTLRHNSTLRKLTWTEIVLSNVQGLFGSSNCDVF